MGNKLPGYRAAGQPRPAFFALKLVNEKLTGFTSLDKLDLGAGIWAYRFTLPSGPLWVLWLDDGVLYLPGQALPAVPVEFEFEAPNALLTYTPVDIGAGDPETRLLASSNGVLSFLLDSSPVFVQVSP